MTEINERDIAVFEAASARSVYTSSWNAISSDTIEGLERIIEDSIALQPHIRSVSVSIDTRWSRKSRIQSLNTVNLRKDASCELAVLYKIS